MGCDGRYVAEFLKYLSDFVANIRPDDPLPVRAPNYKVTESEIDGQILDIVHHYLNSRECPPYVREYVGHQVWMAIRDPEENGEDFDQPDTANQTYDIMKLIQDVTSKANTVIQELHNTLTVDQVEKLPRYHPISHFAIKNGRRKMEDRHVIIHDLNTLYGLNFKQPHAYYGVFDGHAGIDAAVYSAAHLHQYMIQNPQYETNPEAALKHAFHITDTNFIKKASKEKLKGGTTAVVALVREKRLVVAWLGDSQALLVRRRTPVRMVEPHKPELPVERERVEEMGGCVLNIQGTWRVLGQLAVSRAIGDREYKPFVSSECDIKSLEIEGDEDFLILACDGLWDTLSPEAAVNLVYAYLTRNDGDTDGVGRCLVEAARNTGSEDNITAVVVFLRPVSTIMEEEAQRIAQGQVSEPVPEAVLCKDSTPSSINAIFSPPINQFDHNNAEPPTYNPFDGEIPHKMDTEDAITPASHHLQLQEEPMEGTEAPHVSVRDSDSEEGLPAAGNNDQAFNPHEAPTPTAEEVDAALAELDSIPDEVCESGDVEEEDEDEEEWSYYRMDLQTQPQAEDVLVQGSSDVVSPEQKTDNKAVVPQEFMEESKQDDLQTDNLSPRNKSPDFSQIISEDPRFNKETNLMETSISNVGEYLDNYEAPSSPPAPGSPRSVEGFVTSVELNTPEEIGGPMHTQDMNGSGVEQSSGPFSVYVSSSPEPVSLDPHNQTSGDLGNMHEMTNGQVDHELEQSGDFSPVEIVHAQSTVEVVASPPLSGEETDMPCVESSPEVPVNQVEDVTFIPEPTVEPTAEKPVPVFIDETTTPVSEGEQEIPSDALGDLPTSESVSPDFLSKEPPGEANLLDEPSTMATSLPQQAEEQIPLSHTATLAEPMLPDMPQDSTPESMEPSLLPVIHSPEPSLLPVIHSPEPSIPKSSVEHIPVDYLSGSLSPVVEPSPATTSPLLETSPVPLSPVQEPSPSPPLSPVQEPSPSPMSPVQEPSPSPMSPVQEPSPSPMSPVQEPSPSPMSPVQEPSPSPPLSPAPEPSAALISPILQPTPATTFPDIEATPVPTSVTEPAHAPRSPVLDPTPESESVVLESTPAPISPVLESVPPPMSSIVEVSSTPEAPMLAPVPPPEEETPEWSSVKESSVQEPEVVKEVPSVSPVLLETSSAALDSEVVSAATTTPVTNLTKSETEVLKSEKDEIIINEGTVVIPVVPEDSKEIIKEAPKSPVKTTKTVNKAHDTAGKSTPRSTPGKATPSRTTSAKAPVTRSVEKKPTTSSRPAPKPAGAKASTERTTPSATTTKSRTTPVSSAPSRQPVTKPSTKPVPRTTTTKAPITTTTKATTEKKPSRPAAAPTSRAPLNKPSAAPSKSAQPPPPARNTTTAPMKRPVSAPVKKMEKPDTKVNGTATKPAPRTTSSRPATASTVTRKPLSATTKSVPEKETKNTTNRILSTTAKSSTKSSPGTVRSITNRTITGSTSATKTTTSTSTSKAKATSITKSTTTTTTSKQAGTALKKTMVSKTTLKTKTAASSAVSSGKVKKSEVITGPVANGENKIAHEETTVEVIEKCAAEDVIQCPTTEQLVSTETVEVLVNGDH